MSIEIKAPIWRKYRNAFSPRAQELFGHVNERGFEVFVLDGDVKQHGPTIAPRENQPFYVGFRDTNGEWHPEMVVSFHPNGTTVTYLDDSLAARPPYPLFTIGNGAGSYFPQILEVYPELSGADLLTTANDWLTRRNLIAFRYFIGDSEVAGEFIAPVELAQALISFALLHRIPTYDELDSLSPPDCTQMVAPGLRRTIFDGRQNVTFYPEPNRMLIIGNSVYRGCLPKKPQFVAISTALGRKGHMAAHASVAVPWTRLPDGVNCGVMNKCDSGRGKTELRMGAEHFLDPAGKLILGVRGTAEEPRILTIGFNRLSHPEWLSKGDDGQVIFNCSGDGNPLFLAKNWERGAFDRNSGAYGPGDIKELDRMMKLARGWWNVITDNIRANPGDEIEHWNRVMVEGNPSPNPRVTYSNTLLAQVGVKTSQEEQRIAHCFYAFAPIDGVTCSGPWSKLPRGLAALIEILGGPDAVRSKSVSAVPQAKRMETKRVKFGHVGTMAQFNALPLRLQIDQVLAATASYPGVQHYSLIQEKLRFGVQANGSTALKEIEYVPELVLRDLLYAAAIGCGQIEWEPSPYPFLGLVPVKIVLGNEAIPEEYYRPELIFGADQQACAVEWFAHVTKELDHIQARGISEPARALFDAVRGLYRKEGRVVPLPLEESQRRMDELTAIVDRCSGMEVKAG